MVGLVHQRAFDCWAMPSRGAPTDRVPCFVDPALCSPSARPSHPPSFCSQTAALEARLARLARRVREEDVYGPPAWARDETGGGARGAREEREREELLRAVRVNWADPGEALEADLVPGCGMRTCMHTEIVRQPQFRQGTGKSARICARAHDLLQTRTSLTSAVSGARASRALQTRTALTTLTSAAHGSYEELCALLREPVAAPLLGMID